jgi:integrase
MSGNQKTGRKVTILLSDELKKALMIIREDRVERGISSTTILVWPDGQPWKVDHFRHGWRKTTLAANLDGLRFHDLRGTMVTSLADAGCTVAQIASVTGHSLKNVENIIEKYFARNREQSSAAIAKLNACRKSNSAN